MQLTTTSQVQTWLRRCLCSFTLVKRLALKTWGLAAPRSLRKLQTAADHCGQQTVCHQNGYASCQDYHPQCSPHQHYAKGSCCCCPSGEFTCTSNDRTSIGCTLRVEPSLCPFIATATCDQTRRPCRQRAFLFVNANQVWADIDPVSNVGPNKKCCATETTIILSIHYCGNPSSGSSAVKMDVLTKLPPKPILSS